MGTIFLLFVAVVYVLIGAIPGALRGRRKGSLSSRKPQRDFRAAPRNDTGVE